MNLVMISGVDFMTLRMTDTMIRGPLFEMSRHCYVDRRRFNRQVRRLRLEWQRYEIEHGFGRTTLRPKELGKAILHGPYA